jgi:hypothetical protein
LSDELVEMARSRMKEKEFTLSDEHRRRVERAIQRHCEVRRWTLHAVSARTNGIHVVVTAVGYRPETVRDQFKAWCTRALKKAARRELDSGRKEAGSGYWTAHGVENRLPAVKTSTTDLDSRNRAEVPQYVGSESALVPLDCLWSVFDRQHHGNYRPVWL